MIDQFSRIKLIIGQESLETLQNSTVAIFGVGGVGGYVLEALVRSGVSHFVLIDNDNVNLTNLNRQIIATMDTIGKSKVDVAEQRALSINPNVKVEKIQKFYLPENADEFDFTKYDYVVDAIDTITAKIDIIVRCKQLNIPIISAMGAGNKMNPAMLEVSDIYKTEMDPLAKVMRHELKKRRIKHLKVVYSKEKPLMPIDEMMNEYKLDCLKEGSIEKISDERKSIPGSTAFVPSAMGLIIASEVVKDLIQFDNKN